MGSPKAGLEWHGSTLLRRTVGVLARALDGPLVVVRAAAQAVPALPPEVTVIDDPRPDQGPVVGLAAGLAAAASLGARTAFVAATDLPFLHPAYPGRLLDALTDEVDVVLPVAGGHIQPLATAYRTELAGTLTAMADSGEYRLRALFDRCRVSRLDERALLADPLLGPADPGLDSLLNMNSAADYAAARARPAPQVTVLHGSTTLRVAAATLATAAAAAGVPLPPGQDGEQPLVAGDVIRLG
jgi:molybdopterin-guanine dinucleotide biosynthesis protein A